MSGTGWKCFRCNLSFKDEAPARIHEQISDHAVTKVRVLEA